MDFYSLVSRGLEADLKCFVCRNYLSHFPIFLCSNNQSICGRCTIPDGLISFQNETFEAVAQFLKFPCRYESQGCLEELLPEKIPQHEKLCPFRKVKCILNKTEKCDWEGALPILKEHCRNEHGDVFLQNGEFQLDLSVSQESISLVEQNDKLLIFSKNYDSDSEILSFAFYNHEYDLKSENCDFELKLEHIDASLAIKSQISCFEQILFKKFSLKCFDNEDKHDVIVKCKLTSFTKIDGNEKNRTSSNISNLSLCNNCKVCCMISTNPNQILTVLANYIDYPCKNSARGCLFTSKHQNVTDHEANCIYNEVECLIYKWNIKISGKNIDKCYWKGNNKDLREHMLDNHQLIIHQGTFFSHSLGETFRISDGYDSLFVAKWWCSDERYHWQIYNSESCNRKNNFMFEINLIDPSDKGNRLSIREFLKKNQEKLSFSLERALVSPFENRIDKTEDNKNGSTNCYEIKFEMRFLKT